MISANNVQACSTIDIVCDARCVLQCAPGCAPQRGVRAVWADEEQGLLSQCDGMALVWCHTLLQRAPRSGGCMMLAETAGRQAELP